MRHLTSSLGLTLLAAAVTVGVASREKEETSNSRPGTSLHPAPASSILPAHSFAEETVAQVPQISVDHDGQDLQEYASVEEMAHARLIELSADLYLTSSQERAIEPAVLRVTHGYSPEKTYKLSGGSIYQNIGPPLTRAAFEDYLFSLLDGEQQLDYAASIAEREAWWADIISRLESQLEEETSPVEGLPVPPPSPSQDPEPSTHPRAIHPGRNLFQAPARDDS